jgi:hypothetical protein
MIQFLIRSSGYACKISLLTLLIAFIVGLFVIPTFQSMANTVQESDVNQGNDVKILQGSDPTARENEMVSDEKQIQNTESQAFQKNETQLMPQTYSSPGLPSELPCNKNELQDKSQKTKAEKENMSIIEKTAQETPDTVKIEDKKKLFQPEKKKIIVPKKSKPEKEKIERPKVRGRAFIESIIEPLNYELNERFWGWRPNDIINVTDNVNNIQLGILEVTRRAVLILARRISRTGSNDSMDENIENAMNWLMIKARQYWFPSPESKYNQALDELNQYLSRLERGRATFYIRTDNLIPLLEYFEDLLGGCDKSLTIKEDDDGPIGSSKADDYFYYAQGVALAMGSIYRGIRQDFFITLESIQGTQILDEAIEACDNARDISPWLVTEGSLSSIFANHRANIDQPINRIRFYTNVLIKSLKGY